MKKYFVCQVCGHIEFDAAPDMCPVCGSSKDKYNEDPNAIVPSEKEGKEKHVPQIIVTNDCGLIPGTCRDIHIKVGSTPHPMEQNHWIMWIDLYVDNTYAGRHMLTPLFLQPAIGFHLNKNMQGTVTAVAHCTKHGSWLAQAAL